MIIRKFNKDGMHSRAEYSACMKYRYSLSREWSPKAPRVLILLLNPSTANEKSDDPTILRCRKRVSSLGFGSMRICNLFAFSTKNPKNLLIEPEPIGPKNDETILAACDWLKDGPSDPVVICGWGTNGVILNRGDIVKEILTKNSLNIFCLGLTGNNQPKHPLYVSYAKEIMLWT